MKGRGRGPTGTTGATGSRGPGGIVFVSVPVTALVWAAMPSAATALMGTARRIPAYLTGATDWRLVGHLTTAGVSGAKLRGKYGTTAGGALQDLGSAGDMLIDATGPLTGPWTALPAGAIADTFLEVYGLLGDGIVSPAFLYVGIEVR